MIFFVKSHDIFEKILKNPNSKFFEHLFSSQKNEYRGKPCKTVDEHFSKGTDNLWEDLFKGLLASVETLFKDAAQK